LPQRTRFVDHRAAGLNDNMRLGALARSDDERIAQLIKSAPYAAQ
jgi:hypothetical protein